jgi:uncharacterized protein (DUF1778 family)
MANPHIRCYYNANTTVEICKLCVCFGLKPHVYPLDIQMSTHKPNKKGEVNKAGFSMRMRPAEKYFILLGVIAAKQEELSPFIVKAAMAEAEKFLKKEYDPARQADYKRELKELKSKNPYLKLFSRITL